MQKWLRHRLGIGLTFTLLFSSLPVIGHSTVDAAAGDLLNGGFETVKAAGSPWASSQPVYWSHWVPAGSPTLSVDSTIYYEGTRSLKMSASSSSRADVLQTIEVNPGEMFVLSGWIRTVNVQSNLSYGGVFVRTQYLNSANVKISDGPASLPIKGTTDWTGQSLQLTVPSNATRVKVELFFESATGQAWFDAFRIERNGGQPPVDPAQFAAVRNKRVQQLTGNASYHAADPDMNAATAALVNTVSNDAGSGYWDTINKQIGRTFLWSDLTSTTESAQVTAAYNRLRQMALAYATAGSPLYHSQLLRADIVGGLDWMYANRYNETVSPYKNWWDWEIGSPQYLNDIVILLFNELSSSQISNYNRTIDAFVPDPTRRTSQPGLKETGANLADKAFVVALRGATGGTSVKLNQGRDALGPVFPYVTKGDGFYTDGSFVQHNYIAYTGSYGTVLLDRLADMFYLLNDSPWAVTDPQAENVYRWIRDSFEPLIYKGAMMDMVRGRAIAREQSTDHTAGRGAIRSILRLAESAPADERAHMKAAAKRWLQQDNSFGNYYVGLAAYDIALMKAVLLDSSVVPSGELSKHYVFAGMDRVVHLRPGFGFGISMSSSRIASHEYGNGENKKAWHTGNGMTFLYNDDLTQFSDGYWATADMLRLPGTTTDGSQWALNDWKYYFSSKSWVGGSSLEGQYGAAGMELDLENSSLTGKKSWFSFDNEIVALGAGIAGGDGRKVETIVENRKVNSGSGQLTVNGAVKSIQPGWNEELTTVKWAHLNGAGKGDIGYYFPNAVSLQEKREARTGAWKDVNSGGSTSPLTREYVSLSIDHGINPNSGAYSYVLLPNASAQAVQNYSAAPDITVLSNTESIQAVKENQLGITAFNFWAAAAADGIISNQPASVMVKETASELIVAVADPTQSQSQIVLELQRAGWTQAAADSAISVQQTASSIKLTVNTSGAKGRTNVIRFTK
ncbi:polysaccharide lyase family 8 super-sandwich domain-containing protein [Paenibacillus sp. GCM10027627]|uniref:polysaccharide lyase family 8 super-sandwich domain-containing protein n=1 Tax=unclassified Paenibacillus TaxID=185978 RepID=UPI00363A5191